MPLLILGCGKLHREVEKSSLVAFRVALYEADELLGRSHAEG